MRNPATATKAMQWCDDNFSPEGWDFGHNNLGTSKIEYLFQIDDPKNATLFILKWADFV
jgi:hypothetical protein